MRNRLVQQMAVAMAIGTGVAGPASAEERERLRITVNVVADATVPVCALAPAKVEAARIYAALGIELVWQDTSNPSGADVTVRIIDRPIREAGGWAMGMAPRTRDAAGTLLFAFYGRVVAFAKQHDKPVAQILGHVMAHEMGHLLLPHGSHSKKGLMVAGWDRAQVEQIGKGWLTFSDEEGEEIRRKAMTWQIAR